MDNPTPKQIIETLRRELARLKASGASDEDVRAEVDAARQVMQEFAQSDPERRSIWDATGAFVQTLSDGQTFGLSGLGSAALEAWLKHPIDIRNPDAGAAAGFMKELVANRDAQVASKDQLPWIASLVAGVAGAATNPVQTVWGPIKAGKELAGSGKFMTALKGAREGGTQAAMQGVGENVFSSDDPTGVKHGFTYGAGGTVLGAGASLGARYLARRKLGMKSAEEAGGRRAGQSMDADKSYEVPVFPTGTGAPKPRAIDVAGPTTVLEARQAARSVPGRQAIEPVFKAREAEAPLEIGKAFDEATGTTAKDADELAQEIAVIEGMREKADANLKSSYDAMIAQLKEAHAVAVEKAKQTALPKALDVLKQESGGKIPDAVSELGLLKDARSELAASTYPKAIEGTKGQAVPLTPEAEAFLKTPTGQAAWAFAKRARADIAPSDPSRALPEVVKGTQKPQGFVPTQLGPNSALAKPETDIVPDAEAWHVMKRYLANAAKLDDGQTTAEGLSNVHAQNALELHGTALDQQDELFRQADRAYADQSGEMRATKLGMSTQRATSNPPVQGALTRSLTAVEKTAAALPPNEADLFKLGGQHAIASMLRAGKRPGAIALLLKEPSSDISRQVVMAYGEGAPQRIAAKLDALEAPKLSLPAKPSPFEVDPDIAAAKQGFGITGTPTAPSAAKPKLSLPSLEAQLPTMGASQRSNLQRGAAGAFRGEMSAGKSLDLGVPERSRQFAFAAKGPDEAKQMTLVEKAWKDLLERQEKVLGQGAQLPDPTRSIGEVAVESSTPSIGLTIARAARQLYRHPFESSVKKSGMEDAAFLKLLAESPEDVQAAIRKISGMDDEVGRTGAIASGMAGRLAPTPFR